MQLLRQCLAILLLLQLAFVAGCAGKNAEGTPPAQKVEAVETSASGNDDFEDYDDDTLVVPDPLEPWNRFWFGFNDVMITRVIKPVYTGYSTVTPSFMRTGLSNLWYHIKAPVRIVSRLLQGEFGMAGVEFGRFMANSMAGFGGLIDVSRNDRPLVPFTEQGADMGHTFAVWGVPEGWFVVWPFFGPNTVRSTFGLAGDYASSPWMWGVEPIGPVPFWTAAGADVALRFNDMGSLINTYEALTKSAVEPYSAMRDAYIKYQRGLMDIRPQAPTQD